MRLQTPTSLDRAARRARRPIAWTLLAALALAPAACGGETTGTAGAPTAASGPAATRADGTPRTKTPIDELAVLALVRSDGPGDYVQQGTVTGTFDGTMRLATTITSRGVVVRFTAALDGGTIAGRGLVRPVIDGSPWSRLRGRAAILHGSGRFAGVRARGLRVGGRAKLDGSRARVRITGVAEL